MKDNGGFKPIQIFFIILGFFVVLTALLVSCEGGSCSDYSSSSYQLHNKDGTINWKYYNDMQDYFAKHPEKLP